MCFGQENAGRGSLTGGIYGWGSDGKILLVTNVPPLIRASHPVRYCGAERSYSCPSIGAISGSFD